jgi:hypothetical protein
MSGGGIFLIVILVVLALGALCRIVSDGKKKKNKQV